MADEKVPEPTLWEARETQLVICPGLSWEEWEAKWQTLDLTQKSLNWWLGDALKYAAENYGEKYSQVIDPKYAEQHRGILRVALRIPAPYRKTSLSWSAHREAAAAETLDERIELLDLAEKNDWGSREIADEIRRRKDRARPGWNMGPPLETESQEPEPPAPEPDPDPIPDRADRSTRNSGPRILPANPPPKSAAPTAAPPAVAAAAAVLVGTQPAPRTNGGASVDELRAAIAAVRQIANPLTLQQVSPEDVQTVETQIATTLQMPVSLRNAELAIAAIPPRWKIKLAESGEHVFGGRLFTVQLVRDKDHVAIGACPSLACAMLDAALSAALSDMGAG